MSGDYIWTPGARIKADAAIVGGALEILAKQHSDRLTARVVLDAARPANSPLHTCFDWDDVRAAERWREDQARHLLHSIRIVQQRDQNNAPIQTMRAFVNLTETIGADSERSYITMARVLADDDLLRQALRQAAAELRAFEERYASFEVIAAAGHSAREQIEQLIVAQPTA